MRSHYSLRPSAGTILGAIAVAISLGGVAVASIPSSDGTIEGCYDPVNSKPPYQLSVVDNPADCPAPAVLLPFNQTGQTGAGGAQGPAGPAGHLPASVASQLSSSLERIRTQLAHATAGLEAQMKQERSIFLAEQRFAASHVPDFADVRGRLGTVVGANAAAMLLNGAGAITPGHGATWGPGVSQVLRDQLDAGSELSEAESLRLQMAMDRRSKFIETLSNIMKKISTTADTQVQNLK